MLDDDTDEKYPDDVADVHAARKSSMEGNQADWRDNCRLWFNFRHGNQWEEEDLAKLEENQRPVVTFNRIAPVIDSISGFETDNRREVRFKGRETDDDPIAGAMSDMVQYIRDRCDAEDEDSEAYADAITCGIGVCETLMSTEDDPQGKLCIERVPPLEMRWDPKARRRCMQDANWVLREKLWDLEEAQETWPEFADEMDSGDAMFRDDTEGGEHDASTSWKYREDQNPRSDEAETGKVLVIQYQYRKKVTVYLVRDTDGSYIEVPDDRFDKLDPMQQQDSKRIRKWEYHQKIVVGKTLVEETLTLTPGSFSFHFITGKRDEESGTWYGLVKQMADPQRWANTFFSQALYIIQVNAKGGMIIEEDAVEDKDEFEDNWASPDSIAYVASGALASGAIQPKPHGEYPQSMDKLMSFAINSIRDCTGINMEMLGMVGHEQSGTLEIERKKSALTILAPMTSALKQYRKIQGRALLELLVETYDTQTISRITNRELPPDWNAEEVRRYDIVIDDSPTSPNMKHEAWQTLQNILPAAMRAGIPIPPALLKYTPLPDKVATEWMDYVAEQEQKGGSPQELQQQIQQMQQAMQQMQAENAKTQEKLQIAQMQEQTKNRELDLQDQHDQRRILLDARLREMEIVTNAEGSAEERADKRAEIAARYQAEADKLEAQFKIARLNRMAKLDTAEISAETQMDIATLKARTNLTTSRMAAAQR